MPPIDTVSQWLVSRDPQRLDEVVPGLALRDPNSRIFGIAVGQFDQALSSQGEPRQILPRAVFVDRSAWGDGSFCH